MEIKKKINRFLTTSLVVLVALCVVIFVVLSVYLQNRSREAVRVVGELYLAKVNERLEMHYETLADFCFSRLEVVRDESPPIPGESYEDAKRRLSESGRWLGFSDIVLISSDETLDYLYGESFDYADPMRLIESSLSDDPMVRMGTREDGSKVVLFCIPGAYPMSNGETSVGLIGGIPDTHVVDILTLDVQEDLISSFVVLRNGTFVLDTPENDANYFDEVMRTYGSDGPESEAEAARYVEQLTQAMNAHEPFTAVYFEGDQQLQILATPLPHSLWYLITELPFGPLSAVVDTLGSAWMIYVYGGLLVILAAVVVVFLRYRQLSHQQMEELTAARQEAERANRVKSEFFSSMSHDIRTPMNAIVGMTAIASAHLGSTDVVKNSLDKITLSSKQLLGLINDVLDMSKIESGQMQFTVDQMELRELLESIVAIIRPQIEAKRQKFEVHVEDISEETVYCDSIRLNQVLLNLLTNANKYTPEGGTVELQIYERPSVLGPDRVQLNIVVKDNGIGMSPEFQKIVYDSFARENTDQVRRTEGAGLGLAITKYIVEGMGGTIELTSAPGVGSEFHIKLDLEICHVDAAQMRLPPWRVLVVDDDVDVGRLATTYLRECGAQPDWTFDGRSALQMIEQAQAEGQPFDIVLLDWKLPFMDGLQVARRIRELAGRDTELILMSAYDWAEVEADARDAGIHSFIAKPLFRSSLYRGLRRYMQKADDTEVKELEPDFDGKRLLVAEDNELNWEIVDALLGSRGFLLERAADGAAAVERFEKSPVGYYDGILMDVQMPVMDGRQATGVIRAMDRPDAGTLPIIAMTADAFSSDVKRCMDAGMNAHISKPIDMSEVVRILGKYLE